MVLLLAFALPGTLGCRSVSSYERLRTSVAETRGNHAQALANLLDIEEREKTLDEGLAKRRDAAGEKVAKPKLAEARALEDRGDIEVAYARYLGVYRAKWGVRAQELAAAELRRAYPRLLAVRAERALRLDPPAAFEQLWSLRDTRPPVPIEPTEELEAHRPVAAALVQVGQVLSRDVVTPARAQGRHAFAALYAHHLAQPFRPGDDDGGLRHQAEELRGHAAAAELARAHALLPTRPAAALLHLRQAERFGQSSPLILPALAQTGASLRITADRTGRCGSLVDHVVGAFPYFAGEAASLELTFSGCEPRVRESTTSGVERIEGKERTERIEGHTWAGGEIQNGRWKMRELVPTVEIRKVRDVSFRNFVDTTVNVTLGVTVSGQLSWRGRAVPIDIEVSQRKSAVHRRVEGESEPRWLDLDTVDDAGRAAALDIATQVKQVIERERINETIRLIAEAGAAESEGRQDDAEEALVRAARLSSDGAAAAAAYYARRDGSLNAEELGALDSRWSLDAAPREGSTISHEAASLPVPEDEVPYPLLGGPGSWVLRAGAGGLTGILGVGLEYRPSNHFLGFGIGTGTHAITGGVSLAPGNIYWQYRPYLDLHLAWVRQGFFTRSIGHGLGGGFTMGIDYRGFSWLSMKIGAGLAYNSAAVDHSLMKSAVFDFNVGLVY